MSTERPVTLSLDAIVAEHDRLVERVNSGELSATDEDGVMEFICILEMAYLNHPDRPINDEPFAGTLWEEAPDA